MKKQSTVEEYISNHQFWSSELKELREIIKQTELTETVKWGMPVYTLNNKNVVGIAGFKNHFGIWFFQGVFLADHHSILVNAQTGKTRGMRQLKFTSRDQINSPLITEYVLEAIENQKQGKTIISKTKPLAIPPLLEDALTKDATLMTAFDQFTQSRKREFAEYIIEAALPKTKISRLQKIIPMILRGEGMNDKYKRKGR